MPLWSTEEWRARIGSCWCALGRPFNTRFTRCRGKSRGMLTLHQVATMVIMMMLLIAANLGLAATQGHHKMFMSMLLFGDVIMELHAFRFGLILILLLPILKMSIRLIYHLLPHRAKTSLKQFYVDLTHCFQLIGYIMWMISRPAMYVINSVTSGISCLVQATTEPFMKWTQNDDMPHQGNPMGSLVVVILVAIQLFMTVAVARSVIYFLLLTSGDVEQNPGPPTQTEGPGASRTYYQGTGLLGVLLPGHLLVSMNSVQPASSVYIVGAVHVAIAIVVTMALETATAVQASILLRCGDIELNPGPLGREDPSQGDVHPQPLTFSEDMSYEQLAVWLTNHPQLVGADYQEDISKLRDARVNGHAFLALNEERLERFGVSLGFMLPLMSIIEDLKRTQQPQAQNGTFSTAPSSYTTKAENVFDQLPTLDKLLILMYMDKGKKKRLHIISEASYKWKDIANLICDDAIVASVLEQRCHSDPNECLKRAFIDNFINKKPQNYSQDWNGLIELLDDVDLEELAGKVKYALTCAGDERKPNYESELNLLLEKEGYVELTMSKLLITGAAGSGKTCTKHILYKLPPPGERVSTKLIEQMDRAYVAREIEHNLAYYTESTECDWMIVHSDNHELYSMLAATVSKDRRSIGYHRTIPSSPGDQEEATSATSSSSVGNKDSPNPMQTSQQQAIDHESDGKKKLLKKMSDPRNVGRCVHQVHWIHFLDSGGQSAFHDILPAFVHNISVVIFVLKLSEAMDEQPFDDYYEGGERIGDTKKSPYQVKEILKSMIQSMCSEKGHSKLLIIGTHSDKISAKESLSDKNAVIKSLLRSFVGHDQLDVLCHGSFDKNDILFSLNAKDQDEKSKEEAKTIRKRIVKSCKCTEPLKIPISWFLLEEDLRVSGMQREHGIVNMTKCQPIVGSLNIMSLSDALEYFHSLNVFLYFPNSQLSNLVFTKPQIVVTIVSRFVKIAYKLRGELTNTQFINYSKQGQFTKDLILHEEDIARFIDHNVGFEIEQMIELLRITFVVAPISEEKYFIPCVLNYCPPEEIKKQVSTQCVAPMVIKLPGECVPRGFFCAFVCSLLSQWKLHHIGHEFAKVFKNFIHFDIEGVGYSVVVVDSFFYISVHVFGTCGRKGCNKIQELVKMSVKEIIAKHKYKNNVFCNDSILFLCPCGKAPEHFARLITEESLESDELLRLKCAMQDQPLDLTEEYAVWLSEEQYSKWSKQVGGVAAKQQSQVHTGPQSLQRTVEEVIAIIPTANHWKLDKEIDFANLNEQGETIPRHLGTIATSMINWQICIADELGLTEPERVDVVQGRHPFNPGLQRREVLNIWRQKHGNRATYRALITAFIKVDRRDCADRVCQTLLESATVAGATHDMSEDDFFKWLTRKGLSEKDSKTMKEEGITATIFKELDSDDLKELKAKLTFGGKRKIEKLHKEINSE